MLFLRYENSYWLTSPTPPRTHEEVYTRLSTTGNHPHGMFPIKSGTIIQKDYDPPYQSTYTLCSMYDSKGSCSVWVPMTDHHPERFNLKLQEGEDTGWRSVSKATYDSYEVGSYISFDN